MTDNDLLLQILQRLSVIETKIERQLTLEEDLKMLQEHLKLIELSNAALKVKVGLWGGLAGIGSALVTTIYLLTQSGLF